MISRRLAIAGLASAALLGALAPARADDVRVMQSMPAASAVIGGRSSEFFVRFDRPVDHIHSTLAIMRDGKLVEQLHPRLEFGARRPVRAGHPPFPPATTNCTGKCAPWRAPTPSMATFPSR